MHSVMAPESQQDQSPVLTASLTSGVAIVTYGMRNSMELIDQILTLEHTQWETTLFVGDEQYYTTKEGPLPNHQMRLSVRASAGFAALSYTDHDHSTTPISNSYSPKRPLPEVDLIFNGTTGLVFPRTALISVTDARRALVEWLATRRRPECIEWRPYDPH